MTPLGSVLTRGDGTEFFFRVKLEDEWELNTLGEASKDLLRSCFGPPLDSSEDRSQSLPFRYPLTVAHETYDITLKFTYMQEMSYQWDIGAFALSNDHCLDEAVPRLILRLSCCCGFCESRSRSKMWLCQSG